MPLEACIIFHTNGNALIEPLAFDAAYLHAVALGTRIYVELIRGTECLRKLTCVSPHYSKALRLLRQRLSLGKEAEMISDSTILVVIALALYARITGDFEAARNHMEGIRKIVDLRGGVQVISSRAMLAMEIFRYD